jgi:hypothetical protein
MEPAIRRDVTEVLGKIVRRASRAALEDLMKVHEAAMIRRARLAQLRAMRVAG